ncbi:MAG: hypothetical protein GZ090_01435 [Oxalobacteraceae bacterium]|nr:hypothetical protein [Oxalobacteraceae bacterium]
MSTKMIKMLRVSSRSGNFRRAGFTFGPVPQDLPLADLSEAARAAIVTEPMLVALEVEGRSEVADAPGDQAAAQAAGTVPVPDPVPAVVKATVKKPTAKAKV